MELTLRGGVFELGGEIYGAEESSGVNSSPAGAAGQVVGKT